MSLDQAKRGIVLSNLVTLLQFVAENASTNDTVIKIIFKIYDHFQLINAQIANIKSNVEPDMKELKELKESFNNDMKIVEREHTTILGIFAAIVLAFVGTFSFSTAVLSNIINAPLCKLAIIALGLFAAFYCIVSLLVNFLREINGKQSPRQAVSWVVAVVVAIVSFIAGVVLESKFDIIKNCLMH